MNDDLIYDAAIIGGGLAGLSLSIQLRKKGYAVILFEKESYPLHRVCGEYISLESRDFLLQLGLDLDAMHVSSIKQLQVSAINGKSLQQRLPLGGFGISRYKLDHALAKLAMEAGVRIEDNNRVNEITFNDRVFTISNSGVNVSSRVAIAAYGKRANLDIKWKRPFVEAAKHSLNNYVGVKYHIKLDFPKDTIALHTFSNGYCGIVKIEDDLYNLCYLTTAANLQRSGSIRQMEANILCRNPELKKIWEKAEWMNADPVTISQISFQKKSLVEDHVLMVGDAAGMITPLCGNGMSMALHGSKLLADLTHIYLSGEIGRDELEKQYTRSWNKIFSSRLRMGRRIQRWMGSNGLTNFLISLGKIFPGMIRWLVKQTHGKPF